MSTNVPLFNNGLSKAELSDIRIAIATAEWNGHITSRLQQGAVDTLLSAGLSPANVDTYSVPGAVELTFAASQLIESSQYDAVIVFGCVIRGETPHFDYVCQSVTQGVTALNADCDTPVIFGLLTVNDESQANERLGGKHGHKGIEAAQTALAMIRFKRQVEEL
ncbi:MAG: 6,7-dimethyl-8-ribityllumazine synthase [Muribaculaceae bacterium]|nr:6,7-dimethyl-8-ribityllumazine synthase [Muribaculaceae bacterium]